MKPFVWGLSSFCSLWLLLVKASSGSTFVAKKQQEYRNRNREKSKETNQNKLSVKMNVEKAYTSS